MPNYQAMARAAALKWGVNPSIFLRQINQESGFNPNARSSAGAEGIAQFMPSTAASYHIDPMNPAQALDAAAHYDANELKAFHGSYPLALAAYNAGAGNASQWNNPNFAGGQTYRYVRDILGGNPNAPISSPTPTGGAKLPALAGSALGSTAQPNMLAQMLLAQSMATTQGANASPGASLLEMAMLRNQLGAAQQVYGPSPASGPLTQKAPVKTKVAALNGGVPMLTGGRSPYSNIQFAAGVDWQHVNPKLLQVVNQQAKSRGLTVEVNSGYRSNAHSKAVGGFAGDPHTRGLAIDAYINGKPIGAVIPPSVWKAAGITSGDVPNFYNGSPDPEHLQI